MPGSGKHSCCTIRDDWRRLLSADQRQHLVLPARRLVLHLQPRCTAYVATVPLVRERESQGRVRAAGKGELERRDHRMGRVTTCMHTSLMLRTSRMTAHVEGEKEHDGDEQEMYAPFVDAIAQA